MKQKQVSFSTVICKNNNAYRDLKELIDKYIDEVAQEKDVDALERFSKYCKEQSERFSDFI